MEKSLLFCFHRNNFNLVDVKLTSDSPKYEIQCQTPNRAASAQYTEPRWFRSSCAVRKVCGLAILRYASGSNFPFAKSVKLWTTCQISSRPYIIFSNRTFTFQVWLTSVNYFNDFILFQEAVVNGKMPYPGNTSRPPMFVTCFQFTILFLSSVIVKNQHGVTQLSRNKRHDFHLAVQITVMRIESRE